MAYGRSMVLSEYTGFLQQYNLQPQYSETVA
jgi:hypothetical protein